MLTHHQIQQYQKDGFLVVEDAIPPNLLDALQTDFAAWVEESRSHTAPFGKTINDKPRFDLAAGHSPETPCLRRVNAPVEVSDACHDAALRSPVTEMVTDLIGPDVKFHHSKINSKQPGSDTVVKWHQDFPFTPHSNDDVVTALMMIDTVTADNGALEVVPGSHKGPIHGLWHGGRFTGSIDEEEAITSQKKAVPCTGPAGSVCFMHTRLLHGSAANLTQTPRTLLIAVYSADDAIALSPNPMPNRFEGQLVSGKRSGKIRSMDFEVALPELPSNASFFEQQEKN